MLIRGLILLGCVSSAWSFTPVNSRSSKGTLSLIADTVVIEDTPEIVEKVSRKFENAVENEDFDKIVKSLFPEALSNKELETRVVNMLAYRGFTAKNTLLATSLCCDELARRLEDDFVDVFGNNFNLGGLSGFPFAGNTGFGAMAAHIPDDGYCLIVYAPHVGVAQDGTVGKVERDGIALVDNCCGSAIAASNYLQGVTDGGAPVTVDIKKFTDFQQGVVQKMILPHGKRLAEAKNRMLELPYALYDSQDVLMRAILETGVSGTKKGVALLGGIQINTGPDTLDYFHPLRFDLINNRGEVVEDMLPGISRNMISLEQIIADVQDIQTDIAESEPDAAEQKAQLEKLSKSVGDLVNTVMKITGKAI